MNEQQALISAIFGSHESSKIDEKGLAVYKRNLQANATRALKISFPTVEVLIGESLFSHCVETLLNCDPPKLGDWGLWGSRFARVLAKTAALDDFPYVVDISKLDYSLHILSREKDSTVNIDSISLLTRHDIDTLSIALNPSISMLASAYPIFDIYQANNTSSLSPKENNEYLNHAKIKISEGLGQNVLLYRPQFKALVREQRVEERYWLNLILDGFSIGRALDKMEKRFGHKNRSFSFEQWLPQAIQENIITHIQHT